MGERGCPPKMQDDRVSVCVVCVCERRTVPSPTDHSVVFFILTHQRLGKVSMWFVVDQGIQEVLDFSLYGLLCDLLPFKSFCGPSY